MSAPLVNEEPLYLTREEAAARGRFPSVGAFDAWVKRHPQVRCYGKRGLYLRTRFDQAIQGAADPDVLIDAFRRKFSEHTRKVR